MPKESQRRVSWKRVAWLLALVIGGMWVVGSLFDCVIYWHGAHSEAGYPATAVMPQVLSNKAVADLSSGTSVTLLDTTLRLPWTAASKRHGMKDVGSVDFADGPGAMLIAMGDATAHETPKEMAALIRVYGQKAVRSNYEMEKDELDASPKDVSIFSSPTENMRLVTQLGLKRAQLQGAKVIDLVASDRVHGFQIGDPAAMSKVQLKLFDEKDRGVWIILSGPKPGQPGAITQEQVNAIVASIVPPA